MMMRRYFRLRALGRLTLASVAAETETPVALRPRHLAVLTALALSDGPIARDALLGMFWGDEAEARARHSLSNALSGIRGLLGPEAVSARRDHVALSPDVRIEIDVLQFVAACDARDDALASRIYGGRFLDGVHVADAPEFDAWVTRERARLERRFLEVCERYVPGLLNAARHGDAVRVAERWVEIAPRSALALSSLMKALAGPATIGALTSALAAYDRTKRILAEEHGKRVDAGVSALAERLRERLAELERSAVPTAGPPAIVEGPRHIEPAPPVERASQRSSWWTRGALAAAVALAAVVTLWSRRSPASAAASHRPIVAVTSIEQAGADTSVAWLRAGLPRMIASSLDGMGGVEVVAPSRVRDVVARLAGSSSARLTESQGVDVARRVGATWAITGGVSRTRNGYVLDVAARNVRDASQNESFTIVASDPIALGRSAAERLSTFLSVTPNGSAPRYSGLETTSPDAYRHFIRGQLAVEAEQFSDAERELDAAITADSSFVEAVRARHTIADLTGDTSLSRKLTALAARYADRRSEIERLSDDIRNVDSLGEGARAEALSTQLVERFPRDPRAQTLRADVLFYHGRWAASESVLVRELALDSLAMVAGDGPCTPCQVLWRLSEVRLAQGNRVGAEAAARRWVALQPDLPATWRHLSATLAAVGRSAESVEAGLHFVALSKAAPAAVDFGRTMLVARRYDIVDSLIASWRTSSDPVLTHGAVDLGVMLERERGQFAASVAALSRIPASNGLVLIRADGLARTGRMREARAIYEVSGHPVGAARSGQLTAPEARGFTWAHALEADALVQAGDTITARVMVDSLERAGKQSYYARDGLLHHHVRGLMLLAEHRYMDAEHELKAAEWSAGGWTRTNVALAEAEIGAKEPQRAVATMRDAYTAPLDAMGRYVPRSELDWWMARAFAAAGEADSARVYASYVRSAWQNADAEVKARLDSLPRL